jgi:transcriptional regulator with XRE-family HTH domain
MNSKSEQLWKHLEDPEFRRQFIDAHTDEGIAFQIRSIRNKEELKQSDLAKKMNVKQPLISAWENPSYGKYSLQTLKDLAKAFDVGLLVRFVPFSTLIDWTTNLKPDNIAPPDFSHEISQLKMWAYVGKILTNANEQPQPQTELDEEERRALQYA